MEIVSRIWHETLPDQLIDNLINDDRAIQCCVAPSELSEIFKSSSNCSSRHPSGGSGSTIKTRLNISFDPAPALQTPEFSQIDLGRVSQSGHGPVKSPFLALSTTSNQFVALCSPILAKSRFIQIPSHPYSYPQSCRVMALKLQKISVL